MRTVERWIDPRILCAEKWKRMFRASYNACTGPAAVRCLGRLFKSADTGTLADVRYARRVLVIRLDALGDMILTTPFLRELRRNLPGTDISLLVASRNHNLVELCPYINEVLQFNAHPSTCLGKLGRLARVLAFARTQLQPRGFDCAILPRWHADYYQATFMAYLSGAQMRVGYSEKVQPHKAQENAGFDTLLTHTHLATETRHEVERHLGLLSCMGLEAKDQRLEVWTDAHDEQFALEALKKVGRNTQPLVALCPGASGTYNAWPLERFAELAVWLTAQGTQVLCVGGPPEIPLAVRLKQVCPGLLDITGTTVRQMLALLKHGRLMIANNTGPSHAAAAVGLPVVQISWCPSDSTDQNYVALSTFRPWGVPHRVVQAVRPCEFHASGVFKLHTGYIESISVERVREAVVDLAHETGWALGKGGHA